MYQALYRKWRPRTFDDVVGQEHITETLKRQLIQGRLSHAYLFVGTRGTGKTTCAKLLARAVNCEAPENGNPCNKCAACLGIESGAVLDVEELDAASNNGVDNIRALRDEAVFTPAAVRKRVYIVDEVHMLSTAAFNALLKILEEPPEHLIFILATTELHKVPATILSRCQRFSFKRISPENTAQRLLYIAAQEQMTLTDGAASLLARLADGSMRDALSLLDQCSSHGTVDEDAVYASIGIAGALETAHLFELIEAGDAEGALALFNRLYFNGKNPVGILNELSALARDILIYRVAPKGGANLLSGGYSHAVIDAFAGRMKRQRLLRMVNTLQAASADTALVSDRRTAAEMCIIELSDPTLASDTAALCARVEALEAMLEDGVPARAPATVRAAEKNTAPEVKAKPSPAPVPASESPKPAAQDIPPWEDPALAVPEPKAAPEPENPAHPVSNGDTRPTVEDAKPVSGGAKPSGGDLWPEIFKKAKPELSPPQRRIIESNDNVLPEFSGGVLTLYVKNPFAENMVNVASVTTAFKVAAESVYGAPCTVRVAKYEAKHEPKENKSGAAEDKLARLGRFSNVKFE